MSRPKYKAKEPVILRQRVIKNGNVSLYLAIYVNGKRSYEYLKLYLVPERTPQDKIANKETLRLANAVKAKRILEIQSGRFDIARETGAVFLFKYVESLMEKRKKGTRSPWNTMFKYLQCYEKRSTIKLTDITPEWVEGFQIFIKRHSFKPRRDNDGQLCNNTIWCLITKLRAVFNQAVRDGLIIKNPMNSISHISQEEVERNYLTMDEIRRLAQVDCKYLSVKRAFLFSCLTGLRWSDVSNLKASDVSVMNGVPRIRFRQKKTGTVEYMDITEQAYDIIKECDREGDEVIFDCPVYQTVLIHLKAWVKSAGIDKSISFHCARHSFAIMMLDLGVDLYTVSKLLGHKNIQTTQVYARILDRHKQAAVAKIPRLL